MSLFEHGRLARAARLDANNVTPFTRSELIWGVGLMHRINHVRNLGVYWAMAAKEEQHSNFIKCEEHDI